MVGPSNLVHLSCAVDQNVIGNARDALQSLYGSMETALGNFGRWGDSER